MEVVNLSNENLRSTTVGEAMTRTRLVLANTPVRVAAQHLHNSRGRALVVDTGDDSPSIITEFDIVKLVASGENIEEKTVADCHTRTAVAAKPTWTLERALKTMMAGRFRHLVVMEEDSVVGMLAMRDVLAAVVVGHEDPPAAEGDETVEIAAVVPDDSSKLLHNLRRTAKQHRSALKCDCELDWIDVIIGQAEERRDLSTEELQELWNQRPSCPTIESMGGAD